MNKKYLFRFIVKAFRRQRYGKNTKPQTISTRNLDKENKKRPRNFSRTLFLIYRDSIQGLRSVVEAGPEFIGY